MNGLRSIVALSRESMRGVEVQEIEGEMPAVEWVDPRTLFVEEDYQRDVRENGIGMIRRIVGRFSWHRFKPPVCFRSAEAGDALVVVDGQHTAIAAATRGIGSIPVLVVSAATVTERAMAFVGHNRDRLGLTMQSVFFAELAAGDAVARSMREACEAAGARIIPHAINLARATPVGETMAIGTIRAVAKRHGAKHLTRVMRVLVAAKRGPIKAQEITAASAVLLDCGGVAGIDDRLAALIGSMPAKNWEARCVSEAGSLPQRLATVWTRSVRAAPAASKAEQFFVASAKPVKTFTTPPQVKRIPDPPPVKNESLPTPKRVASDSPHPAKPPEPPKAAVVLAEANGITVTAAGAIARKGRTVNVGDRGAQMMARLVRVMPAQIVMDRMAQFIYPDDYHARLQVDVLIRDVLNPELAALGLEVFTVKGSGYMVRDKANSGENYPRA